MARMLAGNAAIASKNKVFGRSYAPAQAAKTTLFAAGIRVGSRKNRQETIFSNEG
jgi:hypothetical protein